jgi:GST-like protein
MKGQGMYTLYGFPRSGSAAIEIALERCGVAHRIVDASSWEPSSAVAELRSVNPLAQIPTLRLPDGSVMTESAAILVHLGLMHPEAGLLPMDVAARAQSIRGLVFIAANCYAAISVIDYPERWCEGADEGADDATRERIRRGTRARLHAHWEIFADQFPATPWLAGADCGALDLLAAVVSKWSGARQHLAAARPDFSALLGRIDAHPAVAPVLARHGFPR